MMICCPDLYFNVKESDGAFCSYLWPWPFKVITFAKPQFWILFGYYLTKHCQISSHGSLDKGLCRNYKIPLAVCTLDIHEYITLTTTLQKYNFYHSFWTKTLRVMFVSRSVFLRSIHLMMPFNLTSHWLVVLFVLLSMNRSTCSSFVFHLHFCFMRIHPTNQNVDHCSC